MGSIDGSEVRIEERARPEDDRRDQGDLVGLEDVGRHPRAVPHIVPDVVRDRGRVARIVLRDPHFDFADQVRPDVGNLRVDAAPDAHEQGDQ